MTQFLNSDTIQKIRATLDPLQTSSVVDFSRDGNLRHYFNYYGFAATTGTANSRYRIGYVELNNTRLVGHYWEVPHASATVFVAHGLFDHIGIYLTLIKTLLENGFSVLAVDMPGHGLSEGARAEVDDFDRYSDAISTCLALMLPDSGSTVFGLGQSAGGSAVMQYVFNSGAGCRFKKIALLAPLIRPSQWPLVNISYGVLSPFISLFPRSFTSNSHDKAFVDFLARDPLQPKHISVRWMGAMKAWINRFNSYTASSIPALVVQGTSDKTVDWKRNLPLIEKQFGRLEVVIVEGARHHLVNEGDAWREKVFNAVLNFFNSPESEKPQPRVNS